MQIEKILQWFTIITLVLIFFLAIGTLIYSEVYAGESEFIQKSRIDPRKEVIRDGDGGVKGYLQQSPIDPRKTVQHDKKGNVEGTWQKSYIDPRKRVYTPKKK